jgi:C1A family cysteine protease
MQTRKLKADWTPKPISASTPKYSAIAPSVDLRPECPPVFNQLQTSSCEGNALAELYDFLALRAMRLKYPTPEEFSAVTFVPASRRFIYYNTCASEGDAGKDGGVMSAADGCKMMMKVGVCDENICPFSEADITVVPSHAAYAEAYHHKITGYLELETLADMQNCLSQGYPFACGIAVYDSFMSDAVAQSGIIPMPGPTETYQGGHEISIVGYIGSQFILRNSWGADWGQAGYAMIDFAYLTNPQLASEFLTIRK